MYNKIYNSLHELYIEEDSNIIDSLKNLRGIIYKITNLYNGKCYIGKSENPFTRRYTGSQSFAKTHNWALKKDISVYGFSNFNVEIIIDNLHNKELEEAEQFFIQIYNSIYPYGYNLISPYLGAFFSEEIRNKISASVRAAKSVQSHPWKGKKLSTEIRQKMKDGHKNKSHPKSRSILQIDIITKEILKSYSTISEAEKYTGIDHRLISKACSKTNGQSNGFIWRYNDNKVKKENKVPVLQIDINTNDIIREFSSIVEAAKFVNSSPSNISACCRKLAMTAKGFKWKYKNETS